MTGPHSSSSRKSRWPFQALPPTPLESPDSYLHFPGKIKAKDIM
jgi:hypothetical protein